MRGQKFKGITYPGIRVFYRPHPKAAELPKDPAPLPLLVFVHGLGGSIAQFHALLGSLVNSASCLAVDLPGCGVSDFAPTSWDAYTSDALLDLLETVIDEYRGEDQGVVFIAHSMGTALAARLSNRSSTHHTPLPSYVMGLVAICPVAEAPPEAKAKSIRRIIRIPEVLFNLWRAWDRWGGPESASVNRFVGPHADLQTRQLQDRFNSQSRSPVFRRMAWGALPVYKNGKPSGGLFGEPAWAGLTIPVYLIGGKHDQITPPHEVEKIQRILESPHTNENENSQGLSKANGSTVTTADESVSSAPIPDSAAPVDTAKPKRQLPTSIEAISNEDFERERQSDSAEESLENPTTPGDEGPQNNIPPQPRHPAKVVKAILLPAGHAVMYSRSVRTLAGLISDFMNDHITARFSLGWQLQYLSREGKWDVKNLAKWKSVQPVSEPIGNIFRAMKTLREVDDEHSPRVFTEKWGTIIKDIIDISHDNPVYDPRNFGNGIKYYKLPTVSKIPPTDMDVANFIKLVDEIREEQKVRAASEPDWSENYVIGVHCHYGFNRTGYFLVCYLVERCGYDVQEAIDEFARGRPNGIRHSHFLDRLALRYSDQRA
ncbi:hypothetical protein DL771_007769 [Monosporascus sp. 5C6A]|nr:hypothetical protein DL771_007769 [Monosporascus sp. 5C6A]